MSPSHVHIHTRTCTCMWLLMVYNKVYFKHTCMYEAPNGQEAFWDCSFVVGISDVRYTCRYWTSDNVACNHNLAAIKNSRTFRVYYTCTCIGTYMYIILHPESPWILTVQVCECGLCLHTSCHKLSECAWSHRQLYAFTYVLSMM